MVKKILLILFSITFIVACGSPEDDKQGKSKQTEIENQDIADENETDDESGINVEKGLFNVELTLPASLFPEDEYGEGQMINSIYYYVFDREEAVKRIGKYIYLDER